MRDKLEGDRTQKGGGKSQSIEKEKKRRGERESDRTDKATGD